MPNYRRYYIPDRMVFVTSVTKNRHPLFASEENIELLKQCFNKVRSIYDFKNFAYVFLPDHFHWLFLPSQPEELSKIVSAVKRDFSWRYKERLHGNAALRGSNSVGRQSFADKQRGSDSVGRQSFADKLWQDRFYDHLIRDDKDFEKHIDYIHFNPVKHGIVQHATLYPHSSLREWINRGIYSEDWGSVEPEDIKNLNLE